MKDYYSILGIDRDSSRDSVKHAFRLLAKRYHPDHHPEDPLAEERFKEIAEAYEVLGDDSMRRQYDHTLSLHEGGVPWQTMDAQAFQELFKQMADMGLMFGNRFGPGGCRRGFGRGCRRFWREDGP